MRLAFGRTATPIKHIVVIFQENVSFDHYFGTYPNAANTNGQSFNAARTPRPSTGSCRRRVRRCHRASSTPRTC